MNITIHKNGEQLGPFTELQVAEMLKSGQLAPEDLAWTEGMDEWKPLSSFENLPPLPAPPSPLAAQATPPSAVKKTKPLARWSLILGIIFLAGCGIVLLLVSLLHTQATQKTEKCKATIYITCDNAYSLWLNGIELGLGADLGVLYSYPVEIGNGDILAIKGYDWEQGNHSAALYCCIVLDKDNRWFATDTDWHCSISKINATWPMTNNQFESPVKVSKENVWARFPGFVAGFKSKNPNLHGDGIWSGVNSKNAYFKEIIDLSKFKSQQGN